MNNSELLRVPDVVCDLDRWNGCLWERTPQVIIDILGAYPQMGGLVKGMFDRDPYTSVHGVQVADFFQRMVVNCGIAFGWSEQVIEEILARTGVVFLHDIGKMAVHEDPDVCWGIIHNFDRVERSTFLIASQWTHAQVGGLLVKSMIEDGLDLPRTWADFIGLHHPGGDDWLRREWRDLSRRIDEHRDWPLGAVVMGLFKLSDTAVAMGLERPHNTTVFPEDVIASVLRGIVDDTSVFATFGEDMEAVREQVVMMSLRVLASMRGDYIAQPWLGERMITSEPNTWLDQMIHRLHSKHGGLMRGWAEKVHARFL